MTNKWRLERAGLFNFWYYGNQIFHFSDGKILLRGTNGSGKSVTMQSLFPVLLDGRMETKRLDSFGSSARRMEDYLLGEAEVSKENNRTGYLMLEYCKPETKEYFTTGIGLSARRGGKLNKWYFVITDGTRVGKDGLALIEDLGGGNYEALTQKRLKTKLEVTGSGKVFKTQGEYMTFVNQRVFGFESVEQYEELIKLLIQLRSPKLSKDFKPTVIYEILADSLPPLKNDALQPLSQTIDQIDHYRNRLEQLSIEAAAMDNLLRYYQPYREEKIGQLAGIWLEKQASLNQVTKTFQQGETQLRETKERIRTLTTCIEETQIRQEVVQDSLLQLQEDDRFRLVEAGQRLAEDLANNEQKQHKLLDKLGRKQHQHQQEQQRIDMLTSEAEAYQQDMTDLLAALFDYASTFDFDAETQELQRMLHNQETPKKAIEQINYWRKLVKERQQLLIVGQQLLRDYHRLREACRQLDIEVGVKTKTYDEAQKHASQWSQTVTEELDTLRESLYQWKESFSFPLLDQYFTEILQRFEQLPDEKMNYQIVKQPLYQLQQALQQQINQQIYPLAHQKEQLAAEVGALQTQREMWLQKQDPVPKRTKQTDIFRQQLEVAQIAHYSFYETIDFLPGISDAVKNRLEAALGELGLLDSLVVLEPLDLADDRQLLPGNRFVLGETLADFFQPEVTLPPEFQSYVMTLLQSVSVAKDSEAQELLITPEGHYQLSILQGQANASYQASYIGKSSREAFRQRRIAALEAEIEVIEEKQTVLMKQIAHFDQQLLVLAQQIAAFPTDEQLQDVWKEYQSAQQTVENLRWSLQRLQEQLLQLEKEAKEKQYESTKHFDTYHGDQSEAGLAEGIKYGQDYETTLNDLKLTVNNLALRQSYLHERLIVAADLDEELQELQIEQDELAAVVVRLQGLLAENQAQQDIEDLEKLRIQLANRRSESQQLKQQLQQAQQDKEQSVRLEGKLESQQIQLAEEKQQLEAQTTLWQETYHVEVRRSQKADFDDLLEQAKQDRRSINTDVLAKREEAFENVYRRYENDLLEYRPAIRFEQSVSEQPELPDLAHWLMMNQQKIVYLDMDGQLEDPFTVREKVVEQIETTRLYLSREDEELFRQIIFDSVGWVLRSAIDKAQKWVSKMDILLKNQGKENSSGLTLSLKWEPISDESDNNLSTSKLIQLLKKDVTTLRDEDLAAMRHYFEEKISMAKAMQDAELGNDNLFETIQEILDYRQWFEFKLFYKKGEVAFKPLTNNHFFKFSGGEKAIAMYLPLFAAVYSRYQDAADTAPYIITLDEAFAGIDDKNIAGLFAACEDLDFNYVMNSQSLYGEFETVTSLNTYEIIRPKNSPTVSTICYQWNGKTSNVFFEDDPW